MMQRRSFIAGVAAALAAPAVVKASSLMKIVSSAPEMVVIGQDIAVKNGLITSEWMTMEFSRLLSREGVRSSGMVASDLSPKQMAQLNIQFACGYADRMLAPSDFSQRILRPAAANMARATKGKRVVSGLALPRNMHEASLASAYGVESRMITDYHIGMDALVTSFDILTMA